MRHWSSSRTLFVAAIALAAFSGCGDQKDPGANLAIAVTPSKVAIVPGNGQNCQDKKQTKADPSTISKSVGEYRIVFSNFRLQWQSVDTLYVTSIKVIIDSPSIEGGTFTGTLDSDELEALLASSGAKIVGAQDINSSDANARGTTVPYAPCGLTVGGIPLPEGTTTFIATVTIEVTGYSENSSGEQSRVFKRINATAEY